MDVFSASTTTGVRATRATALRPSLASMMRFIKFKWSCHAPAAAQGLARFVGQSAATRQLDNGLEMSISSINIHPTTHHLHSCSPAWADHGHPGGLVMPGTRVSDVKLSYVACGGRKSRTASRPMAKCSVTAPRESSVRVQVPNRPGWSPNRVSAGMGQNLADPMAQTQWYLLT